MMNGPSGPYGPQGQQYGPMGQQQQQQQPGGGMYPQQQQQQQPAPAPAPQQLKAETSEREKEEKKETEAKQALILSETKQGQTEVKLEVAKLSSKLEEISGKVSSYWKCCMYICTSGRSGYLVSPGEPLAIGYFSGTQNSF